MYNYKKISSGSSYFYTVLAVIVSVMFLFPLYWMLACSLKTEVDIFKSPPTLIPTSLYFDAYLDLIGGKYDMFRACINSIIISISAMALSVVLAVPAAYGLARFKFKGRKLFIMSFLITQMLPATLVLTPLFIIFNKMALLNSFISPVIADATIGIPFSVLILRTYFLTIPKELDDSAKIDGCNSLTAFTRIMLPIAYPGVIVATVFSFLFAWGDLIYSLTFINKQSMRPLTAGIYNFVGQYGIQWNRVMAFGFVTVLPVVLIFIFMQKYIVSGLTSGAVKG